MRAWQQRHPRRGAGMAPILMLIIGIVMLAIGIAIGRGLNTAKDAGETASVTEAKPVEFIDDDELYDEAAEEAARRAYEKLNQQQTESESESIDAAPPVVFEPSVLDFGTVPPGRLVKGTVQIRNVGSEPLLIEASVPSCSCTAVDMSNTWIQPGEAVPMETTFTKQDLGDKQAAVRLKFRGYEQIATVDLTATVALPVMAEPAYIYAKFDGDTDRTIVTNGQFVVRSADGQPFRILAIDGREPNYVNFDPAVDSPRNTYQIAWDLSDVDDRRCVRADGTRLRRFWVVETDHPDCPVFDIQVRHLCTLPERLGSRRWVVSPQRVLIGELRAGESTDVEVLMKWLPHSSHNEDVYTVLDQSDLVEVELLDFERARGDGDEDTVRLRVTVSEDHPEGLIYVKSHLHTGANSAPLLILGRVAR